MMHGARFLGGPYDGAEFTFTQRMPDRFAVEIECFDTDTDDPNFRKAFFANAEVEPSAEEIVFIRNAKSLIAKYVRDADEHGTPLYRHVGWSVDGVASSIAADA